MSIRTYLLCACVAASPFIAARLVSWALHLDNVNALLGGTP